MFRPLHIISHHFDVMNLVSPISCLSLSCSCTHIPSLDAYIPWRLIPQLEL